LLLAQEVRLAQHLVLKTDPTAVRQLLGRLSLLSAVEVAVVPAV